MNSVLFVCLGNICRSPMAEGIMRKLLRQAGRDDIEVDSAGTAGYHTSDSADPRTKAVLAAHDASFTHQARQINMGDLRFDLILVMDQQNLAHLQQAFPDHHHKIRLVLGDSEVPDPYYGNLADFEAVYTLLEPKIQQLLTDPDDHQ
jgi:protein-tyrosine phosphatase